MADLCCVSAARDKEVERGSNECRRTIDTSGVLSVSATMPAYPAGADCFLACPNKPTKSDPQMDPILLARLRRRRYRCRLRSESSDDGDDLNLYPNRIYPNDDDTTHCVCDSGALASRRALCDSRGTH